MIVERSTVLELDDVQNLHQLEKSIFEQDDDISHSAVFRATRLSLGRG